MNIPRKRTYPLDDIRRFLEPGPVVLVSSAHGGQRNIMTMGWHMMMGFDPALFACYLWRGNHTYGLVRRSRECVINLPGSHLLDAVVGIGNCSGAQVDKFERFGLTAGRARQVGAPLIRECHANFECRLYEQRQTDAYHLLHLGSGCGACRHFPAPARDRALPRQRRVHDLRAHDQPPTGLPSGKLVNPARGESWMGREVSVLLRR